VPNAHKPNGAGLAIPSFAGTGVVGIITVRVKIGFIMQYMKMIIQIDEVIPPIYQFNAVIFDFSTGNILTLPQNYL
jgi:hypothetical protein